MHPLADALREVTVGLRQALESGHRSRPIDAGDLVNVLLAIADRLDPPFREDEPDTACPACGTVGRARILWNEDEPVLRCRSCGGDLPSA